MSGEQRIPDWVVCTEIEIATLFDEHPDASLADLARIARENDAQT